MRKHLRELIKFIEKIGQKAVYTDITDEIAEGTEVELPIGVGGQSFERFKEKVRHFLRPRESELALQKLRLGLGLTRDDLKVLDQMLQDANLGSPENYATARKEGLGLFIRSLVGLDRQAAKQAFEKFLAGQALNANQQTFINLIIDELTRTGLMDPGRLYESPYSDSAPTGPQALLGGSVADGITALLNQFRKTAEVVS